MSRTSAGVLNWNSFVKLGGVHLADSDTLRHWLCISTLTVTSLIGWDPLNGCLLLSLPNTTNCHLSYGHTLACKALHTGMYVSKVMCSRNPLLLSHTEFNWNSGWLKSSPVWNWLIEIHGDWKRRWLSYAAIWLGCLKPTWMQVILELIKCTVVGMHIAENTVDISTD